MRGTGNLFVEGSATLTAQAKAGGATMSKDISAGGSVSAVKIGVKASGVPAKVGGSVPATFTIYDDGYALEVPVDAHLGHESRPGPWRPARARRRHDSAAGQAAAMASGRLRSSLMTRLAISASLGRAARAKRMPRSSSCS